MAHLNRRSIESLGNRLLADTPGPVIRYRLLRDVLRLHTDDPILNEARAAAMRHRWVRELGGEQRADGGWGRFHSQDVRRRQRVGTTEVGVERALDLGLERSHPILRGAAAHIRAILRGDAPFPDPAEKNERWPTGVRLFCASTLAPIEPGAREVDRVWTTWRHVLVRTFASGRYDAAAELAAHRELSGIGGDLRYLHLSNKYTVALMGARADRLPPGITRTYCMYLWQRPGGVGYLEAPLARGPAGRRALAWFASMELVSRYESWRTAARGVMSKLCTGDHDGTWDFGAIPRCSWLSDDPHERRSRRRDWTLRALVLLRRFCDES